MSRVDLQPGFVLHQRSFRDTSLILDVLTLEHGRIGVLARGGRKSRAAQLQPFRQLLLSWAGRGELYTLTNVEEPDLAGDYRTLHGEALYCGYYVNELVLRLLPRDDPQPQLFAIYAQALTALSEPVVAIDAALRTCELQMLETLGYRLELRFEASSGQAIDPVTRYRFLPGGEPVFASNCEVDGIDVSGQVLLAMAECDFSQSETRAAAKRILRIQIDRHLGGRPLKTRQLFRDLFQHSKKAH